MGPRKKRLPSPRPNYFKNFSWEIFWLYRNHFPKFAEVNFLTILMAETLNEESNSATRDLHEIETRA